MSNAITHEGVVTAVRGGEVEVCVRRASACADCAAAALCHTMGNGEAVVCAKCADGIAPEVGERVMVELPAGQGLRATALAYVMPLALLVGGLALGIVLFGNELVGALMALALTVAYFASLRLMGGRVGRGLGFVVRRFVN